MIKYDLQCICHMALVPPEDFFVNTQFLEEGKNERKLHQKPRKGLEKGWDEGQGEGKAGKYMVGEGVTAGRELTYPKVCSADLQEMGTTPFSISLLFTCLDE